MAEVQTLTGKVFKVTDKNQTGFVFGPEDGDWTNWPMQPEFYDGKQQDGRWFNVGKNRETGRLNCQRPPEGGIVTLAYERSPPKGEYSESFWVKNWNEPDNGVPAAYEQTAQKVDAAFAAEETEKPKKAFTNEDRETMTRASIEKQVCLKSAVEFWRGRPIEGGVDVDHLITKTASHYYEAVFLMANPQPMHGHDGEERVEIDENGNVVPIQQAGDPGPQQDQ